MKPILTHLKSKKHLARVKKSEADLVSTASVDRSANVK